MRPFFTGLGDGSEDTDLSRNDASDQFNQSGGRAGREFLSALYYSHIPGKTRDQMLAEQMLGNVRKGTISDSDLSKLWKSVARKHGCPDVVRAESSDGSSASEDYFLPLPWNNANIPANIPDLFTMDFTGSTDQNGDILCECQMCREWVRAMYKAYRKPKFCVRTIENPDDVHFYRRRDIPWPWDLSEDEDEDDEDDEEDEDWEEWEDEDEEEYEHTGDDREDDEGEDEDDKQDSPTDLPEHPWDTEDDGKGVLDICKYSEAIVMCLGRDEDLGICTSNNRLHVRTNGSSTGFTFRIRAYSPDDPSIQDFMPDVAGVIADPTCEDSWDRARAWLSECQLNHERCRYRDSQATSRDSWPSRLVDVGCEESDLTKLVTSDELSSELISDGYLALSYCWGVGNQGTATVIDNVRERYVSGFSVEDQPPTIQDAIYTARELGFRFLWIDTLCIIQDDMADRAAEIAKMHQIYQHAKLLISAAQANTASDGFLYEVDPDELARYELTYALPFKYRRDGVQGCVMLEMFQQRSFRAMGFLEPIHTRAWTMQEHLVSNRILSFGTTGVRWQCLEDMEYGSTKWSQCTNLSEVLSVRSHMNCRQGPPVDLSKEPAWRYHPQSSSAAAEWNQLRGDYLCRQLTDAQDSLLAFSAIPRQFVPLLGREQDYIAGHWRSQLPSDLLWETAQIKDRLAPFPSWCWASQRGGYRNAGSNFFDSEREPDLCLVRNFYPGVDERGRKETARVLETDVELQDPRNPFGDVRSARLLIRGRLMAVTLELKEEKKSKESRFEDPEYKIKLGEIKLSNGLSESISDKRSEFEASLDLCYSHPKEAHLGPNIKLNPKDDYYLLEIIQFLPCEVEARSEGLILQHQQQYTGSWGDCGEFIRIGTFKLGWLGERKGGRHKKGVSAFSTRNPRSLFEFEQEKLLVLT